MDTRPDGSLALHKLRRVELAGRGLLPAAYPMGLRLRFGRRCSLSLGAPGRVVPCDATIYIKKHGGVDRRVGLRSRDRGLDVGVYFWGD